MSLFDLFRFKGKKDRVVVTDASIIHFRTDGFKEFMYWDDLAEVVILTSGGGPLTDDVQFILGFSGGQAGISIPQGAEGVDKLLAAFKKLPRFDHEAFKQAMSSTFVERFVCWQKGVPPCGKTGEDSAP
jgi:hypothetical protein